MGSARIYPWRKMHRSRAPSIAPGTFFVAQPWADCITICPDLIYDRHNDRGRTPSQDFPAGDREWDISCSTFAVRSTTEPSVPGSVTYSSHRLTKVRSGQRLREP